MPRRARLDAPGTLHHAIVLKIDKPRIINDVSDLKIFFKRMGKLSKNTKAEVTRRARVTASGISIILKRVGQ